MQVILLEKVQKLGNLGDEVTVKSGYGRNFLVPTGKALPATKQNREKFEARRAELEAAAAKVLAEEQARNATRAQRKPSEPYVPKKYAATGTKPARKTSRRRDSEAADRRPAAGPDAAHGIPRRAGSALTLRAGMRRADPTGTRKRSR